MPEPGVAEAMPPCRSIPILPHYPSQLDDDERQRLERIAARLLADKPFLSSVKAFGDRLKTGLGTGPCVFIEDHSAIAPIDPLDERLYAYRVLLLAGDGDHVIIGAPRNRAFERYCREVLRLGKVEVVVPQGLPPHISVTKRAVMDTLLLDRIAARARAAGRLNLVPYMGTGGAWALASAIAKRAEVKINVAAPPPQLTQATNDKIWFSERIVEVFGHKALPPVYAAFSLTSLVRWLKLLARQHAQVAIKLPDSAGSVGNIILDADRLASYSLGRLRADVAHELHRCGWRGALPLQVTAWEQPVSASPSVQLWIPNTVSGLPVVEGIFDQLLSGDIGRFSGAVPSGLPASWQARLADEAVRIGYLFQQLGYFGRCSFDSILLGEELAQAELHWIECNGRWGGVSIPMTLANRLVGDWIKRPFVVVDQRSTDSPPWKFDDWLGAIDAALFSPGVHDQGAVVLTPTRLELGEGCDLMVLAENVNVARQRAERIIAILERRA